MPAECLSRSPRIVRKPEVNRTNGFSNSTLHNKINDGLFPSPFSLGQRAVGWLESENQAMIEARAAGMSDDEIRALIKQLLAERLRLRVHLKQFIAEHQCG